MRLRGLRRILGLGVLAVGAYALWRAMESNRRLPDTGWEAQPFPLPPQPRSVPPAAPEREHATADVPTHANGAWVEPVERACPISHPVKAKLRSGIFHEPGGASYERTVPDRCYRDAEAAEADGLRRAQR